MGRSKPGEDLHKEEVGNESTEGDVFHPKSPKDTVAVRRVPCLCHGDNGCFQTLAKGCGSSFNSSASPYRNWPMWKNPTGCEFAELMHDNVDCRPCFDDDGFNPTYDLNRWNFVLLERDPSKTFNIREHHRVHTDILHAKCQAAEADIEPDAFGLIADPDPRNAVHAPLGFRLVQFLSAPTPLSAPRQLFGCGDVAMDAGTMTVEARLFCRVPSEEYPGWFHPSKSDEPTVVVWVKDVLCGVQAEKAVSNDSKLAPPPKALLPTHCQSNNVWMQCRLLSAAEVSEGHFEAGVRKQLDSVDIELSFIPSEQETPAPMGRTERAAAAAKEKEKHTFDGFLSHMEALQDSTQDTATIEVVVDADASEDEDSDDGGGKPAATTDTTADVGSSSGG